jgi:Flp pilus assembly protein TadD
MTGERLLAEGHAAYAAGRLAEAEAAFRALADRMPDDAEALSNLGAVLNAQQRHAEAEAACRAALSLQPAFWAAWGNLGTALHAQQRRGEAVAAYAEALRRNPGHVNACTNLGVALVEQGRLQAALAVHDAAVELAPEDAEVRCNRALALLAAGDFAHGFAEYEWRWQTPSMLPHGLTGPCWQGDDPAGRTILVHAEGGLGDTLQFVRYAPLLAARGARVVLRVQPPLVRLLRRMTGPVAVLSSDDAVPEYDLHCPMLSLPHRFATTLASVPSQVPYLAVDAAKAQTWQTRLDSNGLRVGLVWAGASRPGMAAAHAMNARRSMPAAALAPLAGIAGVRFVSLQQHQAPPWPGMANPMPDCTDFDDTAAVVAGLDLVISVDTSVAHLAGGLGRPVWLLSRYDQCWRWLHGRRDSPWYPGMRLYRQPEPGDWGTVLRAVADDLRALAEAGALPIGPLRGPIPAETLPLHPTKGFALGTLT